MPLPPDRDNGGQSVVEAPAEGGPLWGLVLVLAEIAERVERAAAVPETTSGGQEAA